MTEAPVQIRNRDVVRDIRELASLTGQAITEAVASAVRSELRRARVTGGIEERRRAIREMVDQLHAMPRVGSPLLDSELYDEDGLPR